MDDKYRYIVDTSHDFITLINKDYVYEIVNKTYEKIIGKTEEQLLNHTVAEVWGEDTFEESIKENLDRCFAGEEVHYIDTFKFGIENRYMHVSYYPYCENGGGVTHALVFTHDISKLGKIESKLINYEYRDPLTGLFNQKSLNIILEMELEKAKRSKSENLRAVLFINVLNHKEISMKFGYKIGNILLENTGLRIKECLRDSDFTFSYVGSELVVFLSSISKKIDAARVAEKLYNTVTHPYQHQKYSIKLKVAIGIAVFPDDGDDKNSLMKKAVSASEEAVKLDKPYMYFDDELHADSVKRLNIEAELTTAFHNQELELYYQPIVNCSGEIKGAEALIRWNHREKGLVSPADFIPVAEDTGLIEEIGKWVIFTASRRMAEWAGEYDIYVSLNLCAREFSSPELIEVIRNALNQSGNLSPSYLKLEITESEGIRDPEVFIRRIKNLRDMGFEIYIDDFGTGQSSLEYLKDIPADVLKIDKIFIDHIHENESDRQFLAAMVELVKTRGKKIITEGISFAEQAEIIKSLGCERMQGFYFSRPLPAEKFEALVSAKAILPLK